MPDHDSLARASDKPDVAALVDQWKASLPAKEDIVTAGDNIRFCRWAGQESDGKKHDAKDKPAFPWDGASDTQPMLADRIINELASLLTSAFWKATAKPGAADDEAGEYAVTLVDHMLNTRLYDQLIREVDLSAQYCHHYGWYVLHPTWEYRIANKRRRVTLQELAAIGQQLAASDPSMQELAYLGQLILTPETEDAAIEALQSIYQRFARQNIDEQAEIEVPPLSTKMLRKAIGQLRSEQAADVVLPYVACSGPRIAALRPYDEIFVPSDTTDAESCRVWFQREWVTEAQLRARQLTDNYDPKWIEEALKFKGKTASFWNLPQGDPGNAIRNGSLRTTGSPIDAGHELIEVIHATYRAVDDENVEGIYMTTFHPLVVCVDEREVYARHQLVDYPHGEYPYVVGCREHTCRRITSSRGIPEIVRTRQNEKKALLDAKIDRTSITVLPPVNVYPTPNGTKYKFGPAIQNTVAVGREPRFMEMPSGTGMAEAESTIERIDSEVDNYFGLLSEKVPPARSQTMQANSVQKFLRTWSKALQQLVSLAQRYMRDAEFSEITGAPPGWLDSRRDRMGVLTFELEFDVRELDSDLLQARIEAMNKAVLPTDVAGVINRSKWVELQIRAINPAWAKELIVSQQGASQQLYEQVRNDIGQMFLGNEARYVKDDPTAKMKLQYATQIVAGNPNYQAGLQQGGRFAELLKKWTENLQFSITQEANKQIGAIGVTPMAQEGQ